MKVFQRTKETQIINLMRTLTTHGISLPDAIQQVLEMEIEGKYDFR